MTVHDGPGSSWSMSSELEINFGILSIILKEMIGKHYPNQLVDFLLRSPTLSKIITLIGPRMERHQVYNISSEEYVTFDGMAKLCAQAAGMAEPQIVHYDPKSVEVPDGFPKAGMWDESDGG